MDQSWSKVWSKARRISIRNNMFLRDWDPTFLSIQCLHSLQERGKQTSPKQSSSNICSNKIKWASYKPGCKTPGGTSYFDSNIWTGFSHFTNVSKTLSCKFQKVSMEFISYSTELGLTFTSTENTWDFLLRHLYISTYNDIYHVSMCLHTLDIQTAPERIFGPPKSTYLKHLLRRYLDL